MLNFAKKLRYVSRSEFPCCIYVPEAWISNIKRLLSKCKSWVVTRHYPSGITSWKQLSKDVG